MRKVIAAALTAGVVLSGCGGSGLSEARNKAAPPSPTATVTGPDTFDVAGTFSLVDPFGWSAHGYECTGEEGYDDIGAGAQVKVTDADGTVVAVGDLDTGSIEGGDCVFNFAVREVPATEKIYGVEIADRGMLNYPLDELRAERLELSLG